MKHHPDQNDNSKESNEKFKKLTEIYETLKDDKKRAEYDNNLAQSQSGRYNQANNRHSRSSQTKANISSEEANQGLKTFVSLLEELTKRTQSQSAEEQNTPTKQMVEYAKDNEWELVKKAINQRGTDINMQDETGRVALHYAVEHNNLSAIEYLLNKKASLKVQEHQFGDTPIHMAIKTNQTDIALCMIQDCNQRIMVKGLQKDFEIQNSNGDTALLVALDKHNDQIAERLLRSGAKVLTFNNKDHDAWFYRNKSSHQIQILLEKNRQNEVKKLIGRSFG